MLGFFIRWLERLVQLGFDLAASLVRGLLGAPATAVGRLVPPRVRLACPAEVTDLRHAVLRPGRPREAAIWEGDEAPDTRHWVAERDGRVVGVVTVLRREAPEALGPRWQLRGMATAEEVRGQGVGRALLRAVEQQVGEPLWCNARTSAILFYERHGWEAVGEPFEIEGVGPHRRMVRHRTGPDAAGAPET